MGRHPDTAGIRMNRTTRRSGCVQRANRPARRTGQSADTPSPTRTGFGAAYLLPCGGASRAIVIVRAPDALARRMAQA